MTADETSSRHPDRQGSYRGRFDLGAVVAFTITLAASVLLLTFGRWPEAKE